MTQQSVDDAHDTARSRPTLEGIRVLDLTWVLSGPFATMLLADLGAEVIKVEPPGGDIARDVPPYRVHEDSSFFLSVNRNKKSIVLDLKDADDRATFDDLARVSDVVIHNFSPPAARKLRLGIDDLTALNPNLVVTSIFGFHDEPPYDRMPAFDSVVQAMGGVMSITGPDGGPCVRVGYQIGDLAGGLYAALGTLSAIVARLRGGQGREVNISLFDCQLSLLTWQAQNYLVSGDVPGPLGTKHPMIVPNQGYVAGDGKQIVISATGDRFWARLCGALDRPELAHDPRFTSSSARHENQHELDEILGRCLRQRPRDEWLDVLERHGVPAAPVLDVAETLSHPLVDLRDMLVTVGHPAGGDLQMVGNPIKTGGDGRFSAPPPLGHDSDEIRSLLPRWLEQTHEDS